MFIFKRIKKFLSFIDDGESECSLIIVLFVMDDRNDEYKFVMLVSFVFVRMWKIFEIVVCCWVGLDKSFSSNSKSSLEFDGEFYVKLNFVIDMCVYD